MTLTAVHSFGAADPRLLIPAVAIEVRIREVHVHEDVLKQEFRNRIDPDRRKPHLMGFLHYYRHRPRRPELAASRRRRRVCRT